jgi:hypothetical protein
MREKTITLADTSITLSLSWKTMSEIRRRVVDPVILLREALKEQEATDAGQEYEPKVQFDIDHAVEIIAIAQVGDDLTEDDIGNLAMGQGVFQTQAVVGEYLAALTAGDSKYAPKVEEEPARGKSRGKKAARKK